LRAAGLKVGRTRIDLGGDDAHGLRLTDTGAGKAKPRMIAGVGWRPKLPDENGKWRTKKRPHKAAAFSGNR
jgi:hypothetical protein